MTQASYWSLAARRSQRRPSPGGAAVVGAAASREAIAASARADSGDVTDRGHVRACAGVDEWTEGGVNRILLTTLVGITLLKQSLLPSARADLPQGRLRGPVDDHHRRARPRRARSPGPPPRARRTRRPACRIPGRHPRSAPQGCRCAATEVATADGRSPGPPTRSPLPMSSARSTGHSLRCAGCGPTSSPNRADVNRSPPCGSRCAPYRSVLEHITIADLAAGRLPTRIANVAADPDSWDPHEHP